SGTRALQRAAIPVAGASTRRRKFRDIAVWPNGRRRAGVAGIFRAEPGDSDKACDARERAVDGEASPFHSAHLRSFPSAPGLAGKRRGRSIPAGQRADTRGCRHAYTARTGSLDYAAVGPGYHCVAYARRGTPGEERDAAAAAK